jgi:hypothetical protein
MNAYRRGTRVSNLTARPRSLTVDETHVHFSDDLRRSWLNGFVDRAIIRVDDRAARCGVCAFNLEVFEAILGRILESKIRDHDIAKTVFMPFEIEFDILKQCVLWIGSRSRRTDDWVSNGCGVSLLPAAKYVCHGDEQGASQNSPIMVLTT